MAAGTPRVDRVNGVAPSGRVFRSPFWSGLALSGANLNLVTWVELEDWGADTVDGTPSGAQSVPTARQVTLPTGSGGPTIHFQQASTTLTVDAPSLEFQDAFDPQFQTRHWLKMRVHYTSSGTDRSILADVAVSLTDFVTQGLPPPTISGVSSYQAVSSTGYDPATGLLPMATRFLVAPSSVMTTDLQREFPVLRVAPEGIYLAKGLNLRQAGAFIVFPYEPSVSGALMIGSVNLIVRGTNLWADGPLRLTDASGNALAELSVRLFAEDKIVALVPASLESRLAFVEFASMRGTARTTWAVEFTGIPSLSRIDWGGGFSEDLLNQGGWPQYVYGTFPVGRTVTLIGRWLGNFTQAEFEGPSTTWVAPYWWDWHMDSDPLFRVDGGPGPNEFSVVDDQHIEVRVDAHPDTDRAQRGYVYYCDCSGTCWDDGRVNDFSRRITFLDPVHQLSSSFATNIPAGGFEVRAMAKCEPPVPPPSWPPVGHDNPNPVEDGLPQGADCTNSMCQ